MPGIENNIFIIENLDHSDGTVNVRLVVNANSDILKGHFPGQPVVPGACMLQLVKDVMENAVGQIVRLKKADNIKFMSMVVPGENNQLQLNVSYKISDDNIYAVQATLYSGDIICFKFQGIFVTGKTYEVL
jgi:3-hydroxyacyl-[acyl-carrier-protein] dehydratase